MPRHFGLTVAAIAVALVFVATAAGDEIQLAGVRLGQHAINLLDIWGQPDGIVVGEGAEQPTQAQMAGGAAGGAPIMGAPGAGPGAMMGPGAGAMGPPGRRN